MANEKDDWFVPQGQSQKDDWFVPQGQSQSERPSAFDELSKLSEMKPQVSQGRAAFEGFLSGASANFRDEFYGASAASGLPEWLGGLRAPVGAARLGYEALAGEGDATKAYEEGKGRIRGVQHAAQ